MFFYPSRTSYMRWYTKNLLQTSAPIGEWKCNFVWSYKLKKNPVWLHAATSNALSKKGLFFLFRNFSMIHWTLSIKYSTTLAMSFPLFWNGIRMELFYNSPDLQLLYSLSNVWTLITIFFSEKFFINVSCFCVPLSVNRKCKEDIIFVSLQMHWFSIPMHWI